MTILARPRFCNSFQIGAPDTPWMAFMSILSKQELGKKNCVPKQELGNETKIVLEAIAKTDEPRLKPAATSIRSFISFRRTMKIRFSHGF